MKNIAFYFESSESTGGVNKVVSMLATELCNRGYDVHIISRYKGKFGLFTDDKRINFHELFTTYKSKYITSIIEAVKLRKLIKSQNIEVLISTGGIFFALSQFCKTRHIVWDHVSYLHGNWIQQYFRRLAVRRADSVVTLTKDNAIAFKQIKGCNAKVITINNPAIIKSKGEYNPDTMKIISVGYIGKQKGFDLLLKAWNKIDTTTKEGWEVIIVGEDEGDLETLNQYMSDHNINDVKFLGFRSDVPDLLAASSIYIMSSRWEGMPMVLLEAQSAGLPIVSFDCKTGPSEILRSDNGILVEAENYSALAESLSLMMNDRSMRINFSKATNKNIQRFRLDHIAEQWCNLLENNLI